jgi:exosome complex component RRP40
LDNYFCSIGSGSQFILSSLDFEGATKKNRPNIQVGSLIYARVVEANSLLRGKISCINPKSKKEWVKNQNKTNRLQVSRYLVNLRRDYASMFP